MSKSTTERRLQKIRSYEDEDILEILAQVLLEKPDLPIAAAIKTLGITDQTSIKRLREKHQAKTQRREQQSASPDNGRLLRFPTGASSAPVSAPVTQSPVSKPIAPTSDSPEVRKRIRDEMAAADRPSAPFSAGLALPDEFYQAGGANMRSFMSAIELQQIMWFEMMRTLPMAAALRSQMMLCELTMAAFRRPPKKPKA
jgi:predicted component of type VI protein secretion system